jgi:uncharacterized membrane protein
MSKSRLEAFGNGVIAILVTIMVLELRSPAGWDLEALGSVLPGLGIRVLSFLLLGIYWNNYHHLLHPFTHINVWCCRRICTFFLGVAVPFATSWLGDSKFAPLPTDPRGRAAGGPCVHDPGACPSRPVSH